MKRTMMLLCSCVILLLTACGTGGSASEPATHSTKGKAHNQKFGEKFHYYRMNVISKATSKVQITLSDYETVKEKSADDQYKDKVDYIKVFVRVENVGKENSTDNAIRSSSFNSYDANGKDISALAIHMNYEEGEFEPVELRPGGKNEGFMFIPIEEGSTPAELIYYDAVVKTAAHTNQFVFKL